MVLTFLASPRVAIVIRPSRMGGRGGGDIVVRFCQVLRIVEERDVDGTVVRVVRTILREGRDRPVGGTELAEASGLKRVTVIHHLRRLEELGLVQREAHKYRLRPACLEEMMDAMRLETLAMLEEAYVLAKEVDNEFRLNQKRMIEGKKR